MARVLDQVLGDGSEMTVEPIAGGASGAHTFRVGRSDLACFLRVETTPASLRNPNHYECMQAAADAGVAPPILHVDPAEGILVTPFIESVPLAGFAGGKSALAAELGRLLSQLQRTETFPSHGNYLTNVHLMLEHLRAVQFAPGLLDRHAAAFERIRGALPWDDSTFVSAHNDPNLTNVLYDGRRLWLIDWETASRNDPLVDIAVVSHEAAPTAELQDVLLRAWMGCEPDERLRARFVLTRALTQLHVACILHIIVPPPERIDDLTAPSADELRAMVGRRIIEPGTPQFSQLFALTTLALFLDAVSSREFTNAIATLSD